jgi:hypothetical protein
MVARWCQDTGAQAADQQGHHGAQVVNMLAHPGSRAIFPVILVGFALFAGGLVVSSREQGAARR